MDKQEETKELFSLFLFVLFLFLFAFFLFSKMWVIIFTG